MFLLNEEINYKVEKTKNGTPIAYIDPKTSENVYNFKDVIKQYGGKWDQYNKRWFWWLSKDQNETEAILNNYVNPAIDKLTSMETPKNGNRRNANEIKAALSQMIGDLDKILATPITDDSATEQEIKNKVENFKEKLVNITSGEEFKRILGPIIKLQNAIGHQYSFANTILIWIQDPKATLVKSRTRWEKLNRRVKNGAPLIYINAPLNMIPYTAEEKKAITEKYLKRHGAKSIKELTPGQKEILTIRLNGHKPSSYGFKPVYDHRFTEPIDGKEDLAPIASTKDIDWFDAKSPATEKTIALYDAAITSIKNEGIKFSYADYLGGARGVSMNGEIKLLKDCENKKNIGDFATAVHEFSHELLHQTYLKKQNETSYGAYFIGTEQGTKMIEQQAEVSAWIICQYFGYEMPTAINYMGCWGMDEKVAPKIFDTVANASSHIIKLVSNNMNHMNESKNINEGEITGEYVANLVGLGDLYRRNSKKMKNTVEECNDKPKVFNEEHIRKMVREALEEYIEPRVINIDHKKLKKHVDDNKGEQFQEWYDAQSKTNDETNNYTHFAVNKQTGLIVNGWDYRGYDNSELKSFANDYFWDDLRDNDFNPKEYKILTKQGCVKQGINPDDMDNCWSNRGDISVGEERKQKMK